VLGAKSAIDVIKSYDKYEMKWENVFFSDLVEEFGSVRQRAGLGWQALLRRFAWTRVFPTFNSHGKLVLILP